MVYRFIDRLAHLVSDWIGSTTAFAIACVAIVAWALSGPLFDFDETWQLIVNTSTTIFTFLMLFLVQRTQNHDATAVQLKLDELIRVSKASNAMLDLEEMDKPKLRELKDYFRKLAEAAEREESSRS